MGSPQPPDGLKSTPPEPVWRLLTVWWDEFLEALHRYRPGRYHPIHLQDELCDGRYRVIHKLGYGGHSTVWLCKDQHAKVPTYVSIKILVADDGEDESPDLRLSASLGGDHMRDIPAAQRLCFPREHFVVGALALLHGRKIYHGDFRPSNILLGLESLDDLEVEEVFARLGEPYTSKVTIQPSRFWKPLNPTPHAPKYLVLPVDFSRADKDLVYDPSVHVIDFGESFDVSQPPRARFGIPIDYAAPEVVFDKSGATAMDLWALGCTLYAIRLGQQLFNVFCLIVGREVDKTAYMEEISALLGPPPGSWLEYYEPEEESGDDDDDDDDEECDDGDDDDDEYEEFPPYSRGQRARSIREKIASCHDCKGEKCEHPRYQLISEDEAVDLADLLEGLLRYEPEERLSAQEVLNHPWFHIRY
ncbi:protein kinase domain-containing protein [Colletotrichum musicola]|uniref:EKC/KEOPS complex subunit BUD32 n=1 Tax=Colletotrichum musicola TaxID=2175873 RepID=A0A8H6IVV3_9PEZI|nr:protein kinase domain-containing protein [Colletotrichum musicola]